MITRNKHFYPAVLASAVAAALSIRIAYASADTVPYSISTSTVKKTSNHSLLDVESFTNRLLEIMNTQGSQLYLHNKHLADSSTFPFRLLSLQKNHKWQGAPNHGLTIDDLDCYYGVPSYSEPSKFDPNTTPITVESDKLTGDLENRNDDLIYSGNVIITQADNIINTDSVQYIGKTKNFNIKGDSTVKTPEYTVTTKEPIKANLNDQTIELQNTQLQLNGSYIRAQAAEQKIDKKENSQYLKDASITSCPIDETIWHFTATEALIDKDEPFGESWNNTIWLGPVPVAYMPYARFPITSERQSGILYPELSFGSDGFNFILPIYFNLAPNYDWTTTPAWTGDHHWKFDNQFRYMPFENVLGEINFTYLPSDPSWSTTDYDMSSLDHDRKFDSSTEPDGKKRWFLNIKQNMWFLDKDLNVKLDYSRVRPNDYDYINDIVNDNASVTDDHLIKSLSSTYNIENFDIAVEVRKYQSLIDPRARVVAPFALMPQIKGSYADTYNNMLFGIDGEFSRFEQDEINDFKTFRTVRSHIEPNVKYHIFDQRGASLDAGARIFYTHYNQADLNNLPSYYHDYLGYNSEVGDIDRFLYLLELRGKTTFERKVIDMNHTQTLEPEIKYQYIPYKNQDDIALYDTTDRLDDFYTLFSYKRFAGIDRIANLNTLSFGVTSRILDAHDREIFRLGLAQAYSFEPNKVNLNSRDKVNDNSRSKFAFNLDAQLLENTNFHTSGTYDTEDNKIDAIRSLLRYENEGFLAGISHRFVRNGNVEIGQTDKSRDLNQIGGELAVPLTNKMKFVSAMYYDTEQNYNIDKKFALRYQDCCFAVTLVYEDYMEMDWNNYRHDSDKVLGLQFELKGFYQLDIHGIENPSTTDTHFIPSTDPVNLNH